MRWKSKDLEPLKIAAAYIVIVPLGVLIAPIFAAEWLGKQKTNLVGPDEKWRRWFAWYPVNVCGTTCWFEWIERQRPVPTSEWINFRIPTAADAD